MNVQEFHGAVVSLAVEVSGDAADNISEARRQAIRNEVAHLRQQAAVLFALADAYQHCGVRRLFEDPAGNVFDHAHYWVSHGRIEGKYLSSHELVLGRIIDRLDGRQWWLEDDDELVDDLRSEAAFADAVRPEQPRESSPTAQEDVSAPKTKSGSQPREETFLVILDLQDGLTPEQISRRRNKGVGNIRTIKSRLKAGYYQLPTA